MSQEINLTLTGYRADEALPEESGDYLVFRAHKDGGWFLALSFSTKHRAWCTSDCQTTEEAEQTQNKFVTHWFRLPEAPALKGDVVHD